MSFLSIIVIILIQFVIMLAITLKEEHQVTFNREILGSFLLFFVLLTINKMVSIAPFDIL